MLPSVSFQRERTSDILSGPLDIVRRKVRETFCCEEKGRRRGRGGGRKGVELMEGINEGRVLRKSEEVISGVQPDSLNPRLNQSHFPLLSSQFVLSIFLFLPVSWKPNSNDYSGFFGAGSVWRICGDLSRPYGWTVKASQRVLVLGCCFSNKHLTIRIFRFVLLGARLTWGKGATFMHWLKLFQAF